MTLPWRYGGSCYRVLAVCRPSMMDSNDVALEVWRELLPGPRCVPPSMMDSNDVALEVWRESACPSATPRKPPVASRLT